MRLLLVWLATFLLLATVCARPIKPFEYLEETMHARLLHDEVRLREKSKQGSASLKWLVKIRPLTRRLLRPVTGTAPRAYDRVMTTSEAARARFAAAFRDPRVGLPITAVTGVSVFGCLVSCADIVEHYKEEKKKRKQRAKQLDSAKAMSPSASTSASASDDKAHKETAPPSRATNEDSQGQHAQEGLRPPAPPPRKRDTVGTDKDAVLTPGAMAAAHVGAHPTKHSLSEPQTTRAAPFGAAHDWSRDESEELHSLRGMRFLPVAGVSVLYRRLSSALSRPVLLHEAASSGVLRSPLQLKQQRGSAGKPMHAVDGTQTHRVATAPIVGTYSNAGAGSIGWVTPTRKVPPTHKTSAEQHQHRGLHLQRAHGQPIFNPTRLLRRGGQVAFQIVTPVQARQRVTSNDTLLMRPTCGSEQPRMLRRRHVSWKLVCDVTPNAHTATRRTYRESVLPTIVRVRRRLATLASLRLASFEDYKFLERRREDTRLDKLRKAVQKWRERAAGRQTASSAPQLRKRDLARRPSRCGPKEHSYERVQSTLHKRFINWNLACRARDLFRNSASYRTFQTQRERIRPHLANNREAMVLFGFDMNKGAATLPVLFVRSASQTGDDHPKQLAVDND
ncbi:hypothetical protein IE81DRAFT_331292 [Ceraceosorus guamensis]|uniref:Uncharacterized protein n=1 Tax=Ceraceosorus guamensis TaxID=1522189 RepID=A0A316VUL5_9BASI|nr:hypothetical protein IE81DRAFT_331292 [Ceraceosorus guamensis]PWN40934.1 hypothetical protein IE81DRAFT_331292 [Ceraceosorus guamensis]